MASWDVFRKRNPWVMEVLSRAPSRSFAATKDAAHLMAAIEQQIELTSRMNYFAAQLKAEIDELKADIDRFYEEINILNKYRKDLTAIESQIDRALLEMRTLRKAHTVRRLVNNGVVDRLTHKTLEVASIYAQTKTQPEIVRRMDLIRGELEDTINLISEVSSVLPRKEEKKEKEEEEGAAE